MRLFGWCVAFGFLVLKTCGCGEPPMVFQGSVTAYDPAARALTVRNELAPGDELVFSLKGAEMGATPEVRDEVRLAYREEGGRPVATRVMNLTRQAEIGTLSKGQKK
jgi:hypothetical protein